jgi:hypothetical protein
MGRRMRATAIVLPAVGIVVLVTVFVLTPALRAPAELIARATPSAAATSLAPPASPSTLPAGTYENVILGYRIRLPQGYRRSAATVVTGQAEVLGGDHYTLQTETEQRAQCLHDTGDVGVMSPDRDSDLQVGVSRNDRGISPMEWATASRVPGAQPLSTHQTVELTTIGGHQAVRLVTDNSTPQTTAFVISANDRMYVLGPTQSSQPSRLPKGWIDDIANTFVAIAPQPFPTPTASTPPHDAARVLGESLAVGFAARDVDAIVRLMPSCWVFVTPLIDGEPAGGVLYRSVALFAEGLRGRFAIGNLTVAVDPTLQVEVQGGRERLFVRSDWHEPDRTTRIDLYLDEVGGRWEWTIAQPRYARSQLTNGCLPYRSPWVDGSAAC